MGRALRTTRVVSGEQCRTRAVVILFDERHKCRHIEVDGIRDELLSETQVS
jgi:hypothetical protein